LDLQSARQVKSVTQDIALIAHFREHLEAISVQENLDILAIASVKPISNAEARRVLKLGRNRAWARLSDMVRLTLLEKRGHTYRASPYAENLVGALSLTFQSVLAGKLPQIQGPGWADVLKMASEGMTMAYERGKIDRAEFTRRDRMLKELEAQLDVD